MSTSRRRRAHAEEHGNTERWLLTYADMITLLMAFFILMYTMSKVDAQKFAAVSAGLRNQFGGYLTLAVPVQMPFFAAHLPSARHVLPPDPVPRLVPANAKLALRRLTQAIARERLQNEVKVQLDGRGLRISLLGDNVLFARGSTELASGGRALLDTIGVLLVKLEGPISVEGHADETRTLASDRASPNWDLSAGRALAVLKHLVRQGWVEDKRMSLAAFAANRPVPGLSEKLPLEERHRLNRRVDLLIELTPTGRAHMEIPLERVRESELLGDPLWRPSLSREVASP